MKALDLLRAPLWPLEVFSGRKTFQGNPILGSERLNRRGLHVWRTRLANRLAERRRRRLSHLVGEEDRRAFARDGFVAKESFLPEAEFRAVADEVGRLSALGTEFREGDAVTRQIPLTGEVLARCPALARFVASPAYQGLVRYVGSYDKPPFMFVQTIFSRTGTTVDDPQTALHVDTFHPTVKAWFFLEDIGPEDGPFSYVPGSHKLTPRRLAWQKRKSIRASRPGGPKGGAFRITREEVRRLRLPEPTVFAVPRNTLVVGDTSGIHARTATGRPTRRVEIWAFSRPNPYYPFAGNPLWRIPGIAGFEKRAYLAFKQLVQRLGVKNLKTVVVGRVSPMDDVRIGGPSGGVASG